MPYLKVLRGPEPGQIIDCHKDKMTIGRGRKNDIIIHDNEVSREHCTLVRVLNDYEIHDLNSTNGTFVNGQAVDHNGWLLTSRCIVELGDSITLQYINSSEDDSQISPQVPQLLDASTGNETFYLVIASRSPTPDIYTLDSPNITIGRDLNNDIVLQDAQISRFHLRIARDNNDYIAEDLQTLNGTYLDDVRITEPVRLKKGLRLRLGTSIELWATTDPHDIKVTGQLPMIKDETFPSRTPIDPLVAQSAGLQPGQLEDHVFIAYARHYWQGMVKHLHQYLYENGVPSFVEQSYVEDSAEMKNAIEQAQSECMCLIMIISDVSLDVPYVQRSLRHFIAREKPILLLQYGEIDTAPMMIDGMPIIAYDTSNPERTFRMILAEIRKLNNILL